MGCVYCATCLVNGKQYIGKTIRSLAYRQWQHRKGSGVRGTGAIFYKAIKKYGYENFVWLILFEHDDEELLFEKEAEYVVLYGTLAPNGYNAISGGRGGWVMSPETLAKNQARADRMSKAVYCLEADVVYKSIEEASRQTGIPHRIIGSCCTRPNRKTLSLHFCYANQDDIEDLKYRAENGLLRLTKSPEATAKTRAALLGRKMSSEFCEKRRKYMLENNPFKGKQHTDASLKKMSESRRGKLVGADNPSARRIKNIDTGEIFKTMQDAVLFYQLPTKAGSNICSCCAGKLKSAYGYHWQYADEDTKDKGDTQ